MILSGCVDRCRVGDMRGAEEGDKVSLGNRLSLVILQIGQKPSGAWFHFLLNVPLMAQGDAKVLDLLETMKKRQQQELCNGEQGELTTCIWDWKNI